MKALWSAAFAICLSLSLIACSKSSGTNDSNPVSNQTTLVAAKISTGSEPSVNSSTVESVWDQATSMSITAAPIGNNFSPNRTIPVTVKSLVSDQNIFFLVQYNDPTEDYLRTPLAFLGGDASDPNRWIVSTTSYDDGVSFVFEQIKGSSDLGRLNFKTNGCTMLCHTTSIGNFNPGMYPEDSGQYDLWYWHSGKSNGDGYAEDYAAFGGPIWQLVKDDANADDFEYNVTDQNPGYLPYKMAGGNNQQLDAAKFIAAETAQSFDPKKNNPATGAPWTTGDRVPAYTIGNPTPGNDYYDVQSRGYYADGKWTVKFSRKLAAAGLHNDINFVHGSSYLFSFAVHDATPPDAHFGLANQAFTLTIP